MGAHGGDAQSRYAPIPREEGSAGRWGRSNRARGDPTPAFGSGSVCFLPLTPASFGSAQDRLSRQGRGSQTFPEHFKVRHRHVSVLTRLRVSLGV